MSTVEIMTLNDMSANFLPKRELKNSKKGRLLWKFEYRAYKKKKRLIACLKKYISQWNGVVGLGSKHLIIDTKKVM